MSASVSYPHIALDTAGVAFVDGGTTKVLEIVQSHLAHHWDAETLHRQFPHLGLSQIHSALAYYYDHREEVDRQIEARYAAVDALEAAHRDDAVRDKLRQLGRLS